MWRQGNYGCLWIYHNPRRQHRACGHPPPNSLRRIFRTTTYARVALHTPRSLVQAKIEAMADEAAQAEQSALAVLREVEEKATVEELSRATTDFERERREAEAELKQQLHVSETRGARRVWCTVRVF